MTMKDSAKEMAARLRLDSHHAIQRFGIVFGVLVVVGAVLLSSASVSALSNQRAQLGSTVLYTPTFTTSKTQLGGEVQQVYVSSDRTRTMVLMRFDDPASVSANAENYQAFLTASGMDLADQPIANEIESGEVVVFGSTGYMAVILDAAEPFGQQVLNLTVRANSELVYLPGESRKVREDLAGQASFAEFDQWRVFFNPGASAAEVSPALDTVSFDPGAVYADLIVAPEEAETVKTMDDQLGQMAADLARIAEYESQLRLTNVDGIYITPPATPAQIAGDEVVGDPATPEGGESTLDLVTDWTSPRGFDFDWREGSVAEGYLDDVVPEGESYVTYLAAKTGPSQDPNAEESSMQTTALEWRLSDGTLLDEDYSASDRTMKPLFDLRNSLVLAYQTYYDHKVEYQVGSHLELVNLEVDLRNVRATSSVNDDESMLFVY